MASSQHRVGRSTRLQLSLRVLFGLVCLIAMALALWPLPALQKLWIAKEISQAGGRASFDAPIVEGESLPSGNASSSLPGWLRTAIGDDRRTVVIKGRNLTGSNVIEQISTLKELESLSLTRTVLDESDLATLRACKSLRFLYIHDTKVTDSGIEFVRYLNDLEHLGLARTNISSHSSKYIAECKNLNYLCLNGTDVGDECIPSLARMTSLRELELIGTKFSDTGLDELRAALPDCTITH